MNTRVYENMMYEIQDHARVILIHVSAIVYSVRDDDSVTPWLGFYNKHIEAGLCVYVFPPPKHTALEQLSVLSPATFLLSLFILVCLVCLSGSHMVYRHHLGAMI